MLGISALYRLLVRRKGPLVRVIAFHDVADKKWFEEIIKIFSLNYAVITPEQFQAKNFDPQKVNILLTFDDGYRSWVDTCLPVLREYKMKALFFINSGLLDVAQDEKAAAEYVQNKLLLTPKDPLTWEGARTLIREGHAIGGHSTNHYNLATLALNELEMEIVEDKKNTESKLGVRITDFAYPFGRKNHWNTDVLKQVLQAGYTHVYVAEPGFVTSPRKDQIPRILLEKDQSAESIRQWINGGYDLFSYFNKT